jgi:hypothetical protein
MVGFAAGAPAFATQTVSLKPSDSAYVVANLNDNGTDILGFRSLNTGTLDITKIWYAWNLTIVDRTTGQTTGYIPVKIVSFAFMKFNLSELDGLDVSNATLNLYAIQSNLTEGSRSLVAYQVGNNSWSQSTLTFNDAPGFNRDVNTTTEVVNGAEGWCKLDLTDMVRAKAGGQLSIAIAFLFLYQHNEEQVVFDSPRATSNQPYLLVTAGQRPGPFSSVGNFFATSLVSGFWVSPGAILVVVAVAATLAYTFHRNKNRTGLESGARLKRG